MIHPDLRFITSKGSQYLQYPDGTWARKKYDDSNHFKTIYLGSINPLESDVYGPSSRDPSRNRFSTDLDHEVLSGIVSGFTLSFEKGNHPLGIFFDPADKSNFESIARAILSPFGFPRERRQPSFDENSGRIILPGRKPIEIFGRQLDYHLGDEITEVFPLKK
ncbi:hypothetical protein HOF78_01885 [Candidatus Woesearchaeota archaeon]|jgi:hypothetical protein|nr:hypothetical protein [Candidatus Woesearchaeota archaeon]